jgi:hypothetical protein
LRTANQEEGAGVAVSADLEVPEVPAATEAEMPFVGERFRPAMVVPEAKEDWAVRAVEEVAEETAGK